MTHQIKLTYVNLPDDEMSIKVLSILDCMETNPKYPDPPTPIAEIRKLLQDYGKLVSQYKLDKRKKYTKETHCKKVNHKMHELAAYVISKAENDLNTLISSGFDITMPKKRRVPSGLSAKQGRQSGQMTCTMRGTPRARAYWHQYTLFPITDDSIWTEEMTTSYKHTHKGLKRGVDYVFRTKVLTKEGNIIFSNVAFRMVI
jgi:hypothetical protein